MNDKNIEMLKARIKMLGFEIGVEERLRSEICFLPAHFELPFFVEHPIDHFEISIHFIRGERGVV